MTWVVLELAALVGLAFALGVAVGRHTAASRAPRIAFYRHQQTGAELRRRLFGDSK